MQVLRYTLVGLVVVALAAGIVYWSNRGSQVRLAGQIVRVRTLATSDSSSVLIAEVRIENPARVPFIVREVRLSMTTAKGLPVAADPIAQGDLDRLLGYFPAEGPRYNETLKVRSKIGGGSRADWTVPASFRLPQSELDARRNFSVDIEDVDGVVVTVAERR